MHNKYTVDKVKKNETKKQTKKKKQKKKASSLHGTH